MDTTQNSPATPVDALPMTVWVRGDEEFANEFFLEADDVMQILGIKRSRLTQISGRELRVARRRVGRYVKPFFREADVQAYKSWTRATATHTKSKVLVDQAIGELKQIAQSVQDGFVDQEAQITLEQVAQRVEALWRHALEQSRRNTGTASLQELLHARTSAILQPLPPQLHTLQQQLQEQRQLLLQAQRHTERLAASNKLLEQDTGTLLRQLSLEVQQLTHSMDTLKQNLDEMAGAFRHQAPRRSDFAHGEASFLLGESGRKADQPSQRKTITHKAWLHFRPI